MLPSWTYDTLNTNIKHTQVHYRYQQYVNDSTKNTVLNILFAISLLCFQVACDVSEERESSVTLCCTATKTTWMHQRTRRRILQRLDRAKVADKLTDNADAHKDSSSSTLVSLSTVEEIEKKLTEELESLNSPCNVVFECSVAISESKGDSPPIKKTKADTSFSTNMCTVSFTNITGELNHLYQIVQYIQNNLTL